MTNVERALNIARRIHAGQTYDVYSYDYHLIMVWNIAKELGFDEVIQVACILHDAIEDGNLSFKDIELEFGTEIAEIVFCVTDELGRNREERKVKTYPKIRSNWKAVAVKICDRIANARRSQKGNPKKWKMYQKEEGVFRKELSVSNHPTDLNKAWGLLAETMKNLQVR